VAKDGQKEREGRGRGRQTEKGRARDVKRKTYVTKRGERETEKLGSGK